MQDREIGRGVLVLGKDRVKLGAVVVRKYNRVASVRDLAKSYGRSYGFIHRLISESGVTMRPRGGARRAT